MKPKWQRARFIANVENKFIGLLCFVRCEAPRPRLLGTPDCPWIPTANCAKPALDVNIVDERGKMMATYLEDVELLARDENDFADDVPLISWHEFSAGTLRRRNSHEHCARFTTSQFWQKTNHSLRPRD